MSFACPQCDSQKQPNLIPVAPGNITNLTVGPLGLGM